MLPARDADNLSTFISRLSRNLGVATSWKSQGLYRRCFTFGVWKNSMPKLRDGIGGTKHRFVVRQLCWTGERAVPRAIKEFWLNLVIKTSEVFWRKFVFRANLERTFKRTATDPNRQPTTTQHILTRYSNLPGCCYIKYFFWTACNFAILFLAPLHHNNCK